MHTSYSIEKIASGNRHEALAAAEERRTARAFRRTAAVEPQRQQPAGGTIRLPRQRRWFGVALTGR